VQSPRQGWISQLCNRDLSQNQELDAQPTEIPRHPMSAIFNRNIMTTQSLTSPKRRGCPRVDRVDENLA